jgi:hypothetical protein
MPHNVQIRDWEAEIGIGPEVRFGEAVPPTMFLAGKCTLKRSAGVRLVDRPVGSRYQSRYTKTPYHVTGSIETEISPGREQIVKDLLAMRDRRLPRSFTVHDIGGDQYGFVNTGVCANTVNFKCAKGEDLVATAECIGRDRQLVKTPLVVPDMEYPVPYTFEELDIAIYGGSHFDLEELEFGFGKKLADNKTGPGSYLLREIPSDGSEMTIKLQHAFEHDELWEAGMSHVEMAVRAVFKRGAASFVVSFPRCICLEPDVSGNVQSLELTPLPSLDGSVEPVLFV